jgi:hypothetical protein
MRYDPGACGQYRRRRQDAARLWLGIDSKLSPVIRKEQVQAEIDLFRIRRDET